LKQRGNSIGSTEYLNISDLLHTREFLRGLEEEGGEVRGERGCGCGGRGGGTGQGLQVAIDNNRRNHKQSPAIEMVLIGPEVT
jgi:hypothetical protein